MKMSVNLFTTLPKVVENRLRAKGDKLARKQSARHDFGLTHNLGGAPFNSVAAVSILGPLN
jgi:acetyl-CoA C-acetyltransferase